MRLARTVTGLARAALPSALGIQCPTGDAGFSRDRCRCPRDRPCKYPIRRNQAGARLAAVPPHHQQDQDETSAVVDVIPAPHYCVCTASTANCAPVAWHTVQLSPNESVFARKCASLGLGNVTSAASRGNGLHRIDPALRIAHRIEVAHQRQIILLGAIDVAHRAVLQIGGFARGTHGRDRARRRNRYGCP